MRVTNTYQTIQPTTPAIQTLSRRFQGVLLGFLGYRSGRNHYELTGELDTSILAGATALRRWWVWLLFTKLWLLWLCMTVWVTYVENHDIRGSSFQDFDGGVHTWVVSSYVLLLPMFVLGIAIPYCRNVDYSLFKRRFVYKLFRPFTIVLDKLPVGLLYLTVIIGFCSPVAWFADSNATSEFQTENDNGYDQDGTAWSAADICADMAVGDDPVDVAGPVNDDLNIHSEDEFQAWVVDNC